MINKLERTILQDELGYLNLMEKRLIIYNMLKTAYDDSDKRIYSSDWLKEHILKLHNNEK